MNPTYQTSSGAFTLELAKRPIDEVMADRLEKCSCSELAIRNASGTAELRKFIRVEMIQVNVPLRQNGPSFPTNSFPVGSFSGEFPQRQGIAAPYEDLESLMKRSVGPDVRFKAIRMKRILDRYCVPNPPIFWEENEDLYCGDHLYDRENLKGLSTSTSDNWCITAIDISTPGDAGCLTYPVYTMDEVFHHKLEFLYINFTFTVVHLAFAQSRSSETLILYRKPEAMWFYLNHNWLLNKNEPIYLTMEVALVLINPNKAVFWIQKIEWIDSLDCEGFRGHEVNLVVCEEAEENNRAQYQNALRILARFKTLNIKIQVLFYRKTTLRGISCIPLPSGQAGLYCFKWDAASEQFLSVREFVQEAMKHVPNIPDNLRTDQYGNINPELISIMPPLVEGLLDCGELTLVIEHEGVPTFLMGHVIGQIMKGIRDPNDFWGVHKSVRCMNLIPPEFRCRYQKAEAGKLSEAKSNINNDVRFLDWPEQEAITMLQHAVQEANPQALLSPIPELFESLSTEKVSIFKGIRRMCAKKEIGILIILRSNQKILEKLEALIPDKTVHIYARKQEDDYVVETVLASGGKLPVFSIRLSGTNIDSAQKEKEEILLAVKDRKDIAPKNQSGISNEFLDNMKGK